MARLLPLLPCVFLIGCIGGDQTEDSYGLRYTTSPSNDYELPQLAGNILAVKDFDGDGLDDLLLGGDNQGTTNKTPLFLLKNMGDGSWQDITSTHLPDAPTAANPIGIVNDFNGDSQFDVVVLDKGNMELGQDATEGGFYGEAPILLYSDNAGQWHAEDDLATANIDAINASSQYGFAGHEGLHAKTVTAGDIDNDDDIDLFIESGGGWHQMWPHFSINNGDGTFTSDGEHTRLPLTIVRGSGSWRYQAHTLSDLNNDGFVDLVMGQLRKENNSQDDLASKVVFNNGSGVFPDANVFELPYPHFNDGWTYATSLTTFDFNNDGYQDIIIAYQRANAGTSADNTGCYLQVLLNNQDNTFSDATTTVIPEQPMTPASHPEYGAFINSPFALLMKDMNGDGDVDLVMPKSTGYFSSQFPFIFINQGDQSFKPIKSNALTVEEYFGANSYPINIDGNSRIDFVTLSSTSGNDGEWGTADDRTLVITSIAD